MFNGGRRLLLRNFDLMAWLESSTWAWGLAGSRPEPGPWRGPPRGVIGAVTLPGRLKHRSVLFPAQARASGFTPARSPGTQRAMLFLWTPTWTRYV
ncbi:hypothetical protein VTO73DRAFT_12820 [Trametes versicolor]